MNSQHVSLRESVEGIRLEEEYEEEVLDESQRNKGEV
jgi:hypothetical protein